MSIRPDLGSRQDGLSGDGGGRGGFCAAGLGQCVEIVGTALPHFGLVVAHSVNVVREAVLL